MGAGHILMYRTDRVLTLMKLISELEIKKSKSAALQKSQPVAIMLKTTSRTLHIDR